jgi:hypothetical protein
VHWPIAGIRRVFIRELRLTAGESAGFAGRPPLGRHQRAPMLRDAEVRLRTEPPAPQIPKPTSSYPGPLAIVLDLPWSGRESTPHQH